MNELPEETVGNGVHADTLMTEEERKTLKSVFREYRKNQQYVALLQEVEEQDVCKLFLCGYAKVGKTTLGKSLQKIKSNGQYVPTPGIDVSRAAIPSAGKFSLWDFAGQTEFYVTHNMFLGSGNAGSCWFSEWSTMKTTNH
ncbi:uncharacterized protein [Ptychodera flava]|uniref:uncharacterized protein n=1 Tax=Ptychodera flava TaxID=63121 RepID=UPI00396A5691